MSTWGGATIIGEDVWIETGVYHYRGKVESVFDEVVWLEDAYRVLGTDSEKILGKLYMNKISIPMDKIILLAFCGDIPWCK